MLSGFDVTKQMYGISRSSYRLYARGAEVLLDDHGASSIYDESNDQTDECKCHDRLR